MSSRSSGRKGSRSCLRWPGWPPIRHLPFSLRLAGLGGLTMSLEGDLDELEEFLRSFATSASSFSMRTSNRRISAISSSLVCDSSGFMFPWIGRNRHFTSPRQPKKPVNGYDLSKHRFVYIWADGIYLKAGLGTEKACLMVLIGADPSGVKHLIALREGYRESAESWGDLIRDCRRRGLNEPACWVGDGALGLWAAVNEQCRHSAQQRCTNHKTMNVLDKLPRRERSAWVPRVRAIWQAGSEKAARRLAAAAIRDLREAGYDRAAACLADDLDRCLTFYQFPEAHWIHLRTTNPIESIFATVRLRTNAAKRFKTTRSGVYLMHQVIHRLSRRWRRLRSAHLCPTVPLPMSPKSKQSKVA